MKQKDGVFEKPLANLTEGESQTQMNKARHANALPRYQTVPLDLRVSLLVLNEIHVALKLTQQVILYPLTNQL